MHITRRKLLGTVAASAGLAGCAGGGPGGTDATDTESEPTATPTETTTAEPTTDAGTDAATVRVASHPDLGDVLVGPEGRTLYMFDQDTEGEPASTCYDSCADAWPPLTVEEDPTAGEDVTADLDVFEREDGARQVMAGGWPLYYFASDEAPGDAQGQGVHDAWWVLRPDGAPVKPEATTADEGSY